MNTLEWKNWEVKITPHGPALFDDKLDCHGAVSISELYKENVNLQQYCDKFAKDLDCNIMVYVEPLKEIRKDVKLNEIYLTGRKSM